MLEVKLIEIRDEGTMFSALCVNMNPVTIPLEGPEELIAETRHLRHCGYPCDGRPNIMMTHTSGNGTPATNDYYRWNDRTFQNAHHHITENWDDLKTGDVVDVALILGEKSEPSKAEIGMPFNYEGVE